MINAIPLCLTKTRAIVVMRCKKNVCVLLKKKILTVVDNVHVVLANLF